jgi:hypothetical protein
MRVSDNIHSPHFQCKSKRWLPAAEVGKRVIVGFPNPAQLQLCLTNLILNEDSLLKTNNYQLMIEPKLQLN